MQFHAPGTGPGHRRRGSRQGKGPGGPVSLVRLGLLTRRIRGRAGHDQDRREVALSTRRWKTTNTWIRIGSIQVQRVPTGPGPRPPVRPAPLARRHLNMESVGRGEGRCARAVPASRGDAGQRGREESRAKKPISPAPGREAALRLTTRAPVPPDRGLRAGVVRSEGRPAACRHARKLSRDPQLGPPVLTLPPPHVP